MFALPLKFLGGQERPFGPARLIRDICEGVRLLDTVWGGGGRGSDREKQEANAGEHVTTAGVSTLEELLGTPCKALASPTYGPAFSPSVSKM